MVVALFGLFLCVVVVILCLVCFGVLCFCILACMLSVCVVCPVCHWLFFVLFGGVSLVAAEDLGVPPMRKAAATPRVVSVPIKVEMGALC